MPVSMMKAAKATLPAGGYLVTPDRHGSTASGRREAGATASPTASFNAAVAHTLPFTRGACLAHTVSFRPLRHEAKSPAS